ncbi:MAG: hypothetical protein IJF54_04755 [Clostridia bacterium]|nr:hypothetical protein [Clostridia bacterium]
MTEGLMGVKLHSATGFFKKNRSLLIISLIILFGMVMGAWAISLCEDNAFYGVADVFKRFLAKRMDQSFFFTFLFCLISYLPMLICSYVFGLCIIGSPAAVIIPFTKGISMGLVSGYLYSVYSLKGIGFFALIMLPGLVISSLVTAVASRETLRFSHSLFKMTVLDKKLLLCEEFKTYSLRFIFFFIVIIFSALTDSVMSTAFIKFFDF